MQERTELLLAGVNSLQARTGLGTGLGSGSVPGLAVLLAACWLSGCIFDDSGRRYSVSNNNNDVAVCGNGVREAAEVCDGAELAGQTCESQGFDGGTLACRADCSGFDTSSCTGTGPVCGDDQQEGTEVCDGVDLAGQTCVSQGYDGGTLACLAGCSAFDTSSCTGTGPVCGDGQQEGAEVCDGAALGGRTCLDEGYYTGTLGCLGDCTGFDTTACSETCGDGAINGAEVCDGAALGGRTCLDEGFNGGTLACLGDCTGYDTTGCAGTCGDGAISGAEVCDGAALGGRTCLDEGFYSGTLACLGTCAGFDTTGCSGTCGDGAINGAEVCDGAALAGRTCQSEGFYSGTLACLGTCAAYDTTGCSGTCGDGAINGAEVCDGAALAGRTCQSEGFSSGTLACLGTCAGFDTTGCSGTCGDGAINGTEECDGASLGGSTCGSLGCRSGALACNANCTFNMSGCFVNHDEDGDGIDDNCDNCPTYPNPGQADGDGDEIGAVCEDPGNAALLSQITAFESLMTTAGIWTVYGGTWTPGVDEVTGTRVDNGANYLHATSIPNVNYSVEAMFHMDQPTITGANWTAVVFAWSTPGGNVYAYECVYERGPNYISIYRAQGAAWTGLIGATVTTSVAGNQWHRLRVYRDGDTVRCTYADQAGGSGQVQISGGNVAANMSGLAGLRVYNETTTFTSFVIYE